MSAQSYLGIVLVVTQNDFRCHVNGSPHPSLCAGIHFMLGVSKVSNFEQWAFASLPVQQQILQLQISVGYPLKSIPTREECT